MLNSVLLHAYATLAMATVPQPVSDAPPEIKAKVVLVLGLGYYLVIAACVAGVFLCAGGAALAYRRGELGKKAGMLGGIAGICILAGGASWLGRNTRSAVTACDVWDRYDGAARIWLAIVLLSVAGGLTYTGTRLPLPVRARRPGKTTSFIMLVAWVLAIATVMTCGAVYGLQFKLAHLITPSPISPITPVTLASIVVTFAIINKMGQSLGLLVALGSAVIGTLSAPMIFELPFDLIVMSRTYPLPHPGLYRTQFFLPLVLVAIITLGLLTLSPMVALSKWTLHVLALMFVVFAMWALFGFEYPSTPIPFAMNVLSKVLAFVAAVTLFVPERSEVQVSRHGAKVCTGSGAVFDFVAQDEVGAGVPG